MSIREASSVTDWIYLYYGFRYRYKNGIARKVNRILGNRFVHIAVKLGLSDSYVAFCEKYFADKAGLVLCNPVRSLSGSIHCRISFFLRSNFDSVFARRWLKNCHRLCIGSFLRSLDALNIKRVACAVVGYLQDCIVDFDYFVSSCLRKIALNRSGGFGVEKICKPSCPFMRRPSRPICRRHFHLHSYSGQVVCEGDCDLASHKSAGEGWRAIYSMKVSTAKRTYEYLMSLAERYRARHEDVLVSTGVFYG